MWSVSKAGKLKRKPSTDGNCITQGSRRKCNFLLDASEILYKPYLGNVSCEYLICSEYISTLNVELFCLREKVNLFRSNLLVRFQ